MSKKSIKLISALLTVVLVVMMLTSTAFAADTGIFNQLTGNDNSVATGNMITAGNKIVTVIRTVGMIISVIILMVLGIKYMMGSSEEKASYKKTMMPYLIGAVLLFGASALAGMVFNFANDLN